MMKRFNSLMFKIILLCAGLVIAASLTVHFFAFRAAKNSIEYTLGQMALNITRSVNTTIDTEKFAELLETQDMKNEYYTQLREELINMKNDTGLKYLYTMSKSDNEDFIYVVDGMETGESLLGDVEPEMTDTMIACFEGKEGYEYSSTEDYGQLISGYIPIKNTSGEVIGILGADFDAGYMVEQLGGANKDIFMASIITVILSILVAVGFSFIIIRSLKNLRSNVSLIKAGDLTIQVGTNRSDEVGSLSRAFQSMVENMSDMISKIRSNSQQVLREVESLNVSVDVTSKATEEITTIVGQIATGASSQVDSVKEVEDSMGQVFTEIETITNHIDSVNNDSDKGMKEMQEASEKLETTVQQIVLVNDTVDSTSAVMKKLEDKFKEVLAFSDIVSAISKQTNLLALNASIEAATAGEHGKGFAIVATEIKNLANQSNDASNKINELILAVKEEINHSSEAINQGVLQARNGVTVMSEVQEYLNKFSESYYKINSRIKEVSTALVHIEDNGNNVLHMTSSLAQIAEELSAGTQQTSAATEEQYAIMEGIKNDLINVKNKMEELSTSVNQFKINEMR